MMSLADKDPTKFELKLSGDNSIKLADLPKTEVTQMVDEAAKVISDRGHTLRHHAVKYAKAQGGVGAHEHFSLSLFLSLSLFRACCAILLSFSSDWSRHPSLPLLRHRGVTNLLFAQVYNAYADPVDGFEFHEFNPGDGAAAMLNYIEEMRTYVCDGDDADTGSGLIWKFPVGDDTDNIKVPIFTPTRPTPHECALAAHTRG